MKCLGKARCSDGREKMKAGGTDLRAINVQVVADSRSQMPLSRENVQTRVSSPREHPGTFQNLGVDWVTHDEDKRRKSWRDMRSRRISREETELWRGSYPEC